VFLHLHHGKIIADNSNNLENTIKKCIEEYSQFGIFGHEFGVKRYAIYSATIGSTLSGCLTLENKHTTRANRPKEDENLSMMTP